MKQIVEKSDPEQGIAYIGDILANGTSPLQDWIVMRTQQDGDCLFINDQLQSSTLDESMYHEYMVHSLLSGTREPKRVLILGGAEGCMLREVLRWPSVESVEQVDWDVKLTEYFKTEGKYWNGGAYEDPRVQVIADDALGYLRVCTDPVYDAIFIDLLDPHEAESVQYMKDLLKACKPLLAPRGGICINAGLVAKGRDTPAVPIAEFMKQEYKDPAYNRVSFKVNIPSYLGEWGFLMVTSKGWSGNLMSVTFPPGLKHFDRVAFHGAMTWTEEYPAALRDFWKATSSWANVATKKWNAPAAEEAVRGQYGC